MCIRDRPSVKREDKKPDALAKLTDLTKNLRADDDERATREALEEGDPNGVRGGTANEAAGDPYLREIVAAVLERWTVPTMLKPEELAKLQAAACLDVYKRQALTIPVIKSVPMTNRTALPPLPFSKSRQAA